MIGADLIPDFGNNSINPPALTLFLAILGAVVTVLVESIRARKRAEDAVSAAKVVAQNTTPVSNGFAADVLRRLDSIDHRLMRYEGAMQTHMEYHMNRDTKDNVIPFKRRDT